MIDFLLDIFAQYRGDEAVVWQDRSFTYGWLSDRVALLQETLREKQVPRGTVAAVEADFSPSSVALFLALAGHGCILVPLTGAVDRRRDEFRAVAQAEQLFSVDGGDRVAVEPSGRRADHPLYARLRGQGHPGLVLFSSGSTGRSKAAVHDLSLLLEKFTVPRHRLRTLTFLLYDHIGGVNTMLYTLSNGGCIVTVQDKSPDSVFRAVERHRVELLPTSPTFINLILLSEAYLRYDTGSLRTLTYGTEPMPESTLQRLHRAMPGVKLQQTYGLSEVGILRSRSRDPDSLWVKVGGEGFETRVVDGILWIRARSAMLGYLNAPDPFTPDGWLNTGDRVEVDGEYIRILGRDSEIINVGGEKVYPAQVEGVLMGMEGVEDATVSGEPNPITGQIVKARVKLATGETEQEFKRRMRAFCRVRLPAYQTPQKVELVAREMYGARFKKMRKEGQG
ncbi:MAG: long-chain fatty acid--CoA ligase [Spirochaetota bacterium]